MLDFASFSLSLKTAEVLLHMLMYSFVSDIQWGLFTAALEDSDLIRKLLCDWNTCIFLREQDMSVNV